MRKKILWITETAMMLALLVTLQWLTKPAGQLITGSCVNAVLAITVLVAGLGSGITVALISPLMAYVLKIAPMVLTVPVIMVGNTLFVVLLHLIAGGRKANLVKRIAGWLCAAAAKFAAMFALVKWGICGVLAPTLMAAGTLKEPMLKALPVTFGVTQLFTALIGGAVAMVIVLPIRKALKR